MEIQQQLHEEIDNALIQNNGQFTYDSINGLKYLACCIDGNFGLQNDDMNYKFLTNFSILFDLETLRKYSVVPLLSRQCTKNYRIPDTNVTLEKGEFIFIPIFSIQNDEKYYPNADEFDPSRFTTENRYGKSLVDMPYLPFGDGPRNCIGKLNHLIGNQQLKSLNLFLAQVCEWAKCLQSLESLRCYKNSILNLMLSTLEPN